jgi:hypothetical protein
MPTKYGPVGNMNDNLFFERQQSQHTNADAVMTWKGAGDTSAELFE